jgi:outer membrane protein assembly factor BamE (lipoprotein component of BamABCDE complex)
MGQAPSFGFIEGISVLPGFKLLSVRAPRQALAAVLLAAGLLSACGAQIDRHGHVFIDVDVNSIQPGMTKEQVAAVLGSPDTTSTIAGEAYYYISTTQKTVAFLKAREIDRQVVAVYFGGGESVQQVAHYGLKDGIVVNYLKDETPARGKDITFIEQIFGNFANRGLFKGQKTPSASGAPPI